MREENKDDIYKRELSDPTEGDRPWPLGIWVLILIMSAFGCGYFLVFSGDGSLGYGDLRDYAAPRLTGVGSDRAQKEEAVVDLAALGRQVYQSSCMACHQATGQGLAGAFPPLDGSEWVTGNAAAPVNIVLGGLSGPIVVKGVTYNGVMPGFGSQLSDDEVAAVVSFIRNSWSNDAAPVSPELVAELRVASEGKGSWTADELPR